MSDNFEPCLTNVLHTEGGLVDDPQDPGGLTNHGVTQKEYDIWRSSNRLPIQSVQYITGEELESIYRFVYWHPSGADQLPLGVDYCVFDFAVNSGPHEAVKCLQIAVGAAPDGAFGPMTLSAAQAEAPGDVIAKVSSERLVFLESLPGWPHDGHGWQNRVNAVETAALAMAG